LRPAGARSPVRGNQGGRVDFEMGFGGRVNVFGDGGAVDAVAFAEQQAAGFAGRGRSCFPAQCGKDATCQSHVHSHIPETARPELAVGQLFHRRR